ncbi:MAG: hypothetical protein A2287_09210 [Candidatus Melainabacteria bacterium RIFOXYA12_FULL_32_12]|nr:MAG: hypothetical protein A2255_03720 [Candidatus Melainabacteria bacterium RIFOXYA2_FULL_32_9]OGI24250.1 MAG: hypothetical protein A2287_09210 [Candidatus Melainabacteria bacterium RIFOXYA12_FULL_32_12]
MNNIQGVGLTHPTNPVKQAQKRVDQPNIFDQGKTDSVAFGNKLAQEAPKLSSKLLDKFSNKLRVVLSGMMGSNQYINDIKALAHNETIEQLSKNPAGALQKAKNLLQMHKGFAANYVKKGYYIPSNENAWVIRTYDLVGGINEKLGKTGQAFLNYAKGYKTYLKTANRDEATSIFKKMASRMIKMAEEGNKPALADKIKAEVKKYSAKY